LHLVGAQSDLWRQSYPQQGRHRDHAAAASHGIDKACRQSGEEEQGVMNGRERHDKDHSMDRRACPTKNRRPVVGRDGGESFCTADRVGCLDQQSERQLGRNYFFSQHSFFAGVFEQQLEHSSFLGEEAHEARVIEKATATSVTSLVMSRCRV
jgi:hypothetical protein